MDVHIFSIRVNKFYAKKWNFFLLHKMGEREQAKQISSNQALLIGKLIYNPVGYAAFFRLTRKYSTRNRLFLLYQMNERNIPIGPVGTYKEWLAAGNPVAKGQKGLYIITPSTRKITSTIETEQDRTYTNYLVLPNIFALSQTVNPSMAYTVQNLPNADLQSLQSQLNINLPPINQIVTVDDWYNFALILAHLVMGYTNYVELKDLNEDITQDNLNEYVASVIALVVTLSIAGEAAVQQSTRIQTVREKVYNFLQTDMLPSKLNIITTIDKILNALFAK